VGVGKYSKASLTLRMTTSRWSTVRGSGFASETTASHPNLERPVVTGIRLWALLDLNQ
jgi:hypothetical protein